MLWYNILTANIKGQGKKLSVSTKNYYGDIEISSDAIAAVAGFAVLECYGVVNLVQKNIKKSICNFFKKQTYTKGISVTINNDNRISIDIHCVLKYGISLSAVAESIKKTVKYTVEDFTGMLVDTVNVRVVGVRV
ncbi:MAG: Asp23/Gls24 family envelope stress response protein [Clostridia bacterium]|nr:Asp23/Gls24 family envelope stress response protein [Clostridia bacterium]